MAKPIIYGTPISSYVRTVRLLLEEGGIEYGLKSVGIFNGENESAEYLAKHPFGKVPTLELNGEIIYETAAIIEYLNTVLADGKFSPSDPLLQARMRQIMAIVDSYLYVPVIRDIVIQRLVVPSQGGTSDLEKIQNAIAPAKKAVEAIESLAVGSPYLLGSKLTIADFYLIPLFAYFSKTPEFDAVTAQVPKLRTWWDEIHTRPTVKKVCG
jgi:glutathione S-transferase